MPVNPHEQAAKTARAVIAERFLAAVQTEPEVVTEPLAFPGYISIRNCRMLLDGTLNVVINVPYTFASETYAALVSYSELPLSASIEPIMTPEIDDA